MKGQQAAVLGILAALFGLQLSFDPSVKARLGRLGNAVISKQSLTGPSSPIGADVTVTLFWLIGVSVLLILAEYMPKLAVWLAILLFVGVAFRYSTQITAWLQKAAPGGVNSGSAPAQGPPVKSGPTAGSNKGFGLAPTPSLAERQRSPLHPEQGPHTVPPIQTGSEPTRRPLSQIGYSPLIATLGGGSSR
jgi:hypothetical protein